MGRNAKPFAMHVLDGNRNKQSKEKLEKMKKADEKLKFKDDNIKAPYWLSTRAKNIFNKLVAEFEGMNLITNIDVNMIALYSDAFASYIDYTERIKKDGIIVTSLNNGGFEQEDVNPLIAKKEKAFNMIEKAGSKLGLSPVDRAKMVGLMMEDDKDKDEGNSRFSGRL
jgi:P27 family predicted phage terminase small subunit